MHRRMHIGDVQFTVDAFRGYIGPVEATDACDEAVWGESGASPLGARA